LVIFRVQGTAASRQSRGAAARFRQRFEERELELAPLLEFAQSSIEFEKNQDAVLGMCSEGVAASTRHNTSVVTVFRKQ
jgi:hypothetical protein